MTKHTRNSLTDEINSYPGPEVLGRINKKVLLEILEGRKREQMKKEFFKQMNKHDNTGSEMAMIAFLIFGVGMIIGNVLTTALA